MKTAETKDLWQLVRGNPHIDPRDLADAIQEQLGHEPLDYRTRLLVRDSAEALRKHWGQQTWQDWLENCPAQARIEAICQQTFEAPGFPSLAERVMEKTDSETIRQFLRELGMHLSRPLHVDVGGSAALILTGYLSRNTEDIDVVDQVPPDLRQLHSVLAQLRNRYGLGLTHFQSHYLPADWANRLHSQEPFGPLQVSLVDVYDVFLSKLFSAREKDRDDLRCIAPQLHKDVLVRRLRETTAALQSDDSFRKNAQNNWHILYGEPLPS